MYEGNDTCYRLMWSLSRMTWGPGKETDDFIEFGLYQLPSDIRERQGYIEQCIGDIRKAARMLEESSLVVREKSLYGAAARENFISESIKDSMIRHLTDKQMRRRVAEDFGCSPGHFGIRFKAVFGYSFQEASRELRLQIALHYVCNSEVTIQAAAMNVGYSGTAALDYAFKKRFGCLPGEIRKMSAKERCTFLRELQEL